MSGGQSVGFHIQLSSEKPGWEHLERDATTDNTPVLVFLDKRLDACARILRQKIGHMGWYSNTKDCTPGQVFLDKRLDTCANILR